MSPELKRYAKLRKALCTMVTEADEAALKTKLFGIAKKFTKQRAVQFWDPYHHGYLSYKELTERFPVEANMLATPIVSARQTDATKLWFTVDQWVHLVISHERLVAMVKR